MIQEHLQERLVRFRLRTVLAILFTIIAVGIVLEEIWISRHVLTWILISVFLALALNPAVEWFMRHGVPRRGWPAALAYLLAIAFFVAIGFTIVPTLVDQLNEFVHKLPSYVHDITHGRGRMRIEGKIREVVPGDAIAIPPGQKHKLWNTGQETLRLLCCCAPAYEDSDTVITESVE